MIPVEPRTFRATFEAWFGQLLLPAVFVTLLTVTAINSAGLDAAIGGLGLAALAVFTGWKYALPMLSNYIHLDDRSIEGSMNGRYFQLYWTEVLAAWVYQRRRRSFLCLGTREHTLVIPLRFFDDHTVWEQVCGSVTPSALTEEAIKRLPDYQEWRAALDHDAAADLPAADPPGEDSTLTSDDEQEADASRTITERARTVADQARTVADHWVVQVIGWAGLAFFALDAVEALRLGQVLQGIVYLGLTAACMVVLMSWGLTELNEKTIERRTLFGSWRIEWDEIRCIEVDPFDTILVLLGDDCQLVIPGPWMWSGVNKRGALAVLLSQARERGIPLRRTALAAFKFSRRTRIHK